jgi:adenylosuccinate synthase
MPLNMVAGEACLVTGLQYGDEGKGKIIDELAANAHAVCRVQGGNNAGHTIWVNERKTVTHLLPSGVLNPRCQLLIGQGVVVDPLVLESEICELQKQGVEINPKRLKVDYRCHVILPTHKQMDKQKEENLKLNGQIEIGTTGRGIGPCYASRAYREGITLHDFCNEEIFTKFLELKTNFSKDFNSENLSTYKKAAKFLQPFLADCAIEANTLLSEKKCLLLEGAQGAQLDIGFGSYPFVTSSQLVAGAGAGGIGIAPWKVKNILGVLKAYSTRVGSGPFLGELSGAMADKIREIGKEFGSTTGRPRRIGWTDLVSLKYQCLIGGVTCLALMKADVLCDFQSVGMVVAYRHKKTNDIFFPKTALEQTECEPVVEYLEGWHTHELRLTQSGSKIIPLNLQILIQKIESFVGVPIVYLSTGPQRNQGIWLNKKGI